MKNTITLLFSMAAFSACEKQHNCGCAVPYQIYYLKAAVLETGVSACDTPLSDFSEDSQRINSYTGNSSLQYLVNSLPPGRRVLQQKLYAQVATMPASEDFNCDSSAYGFPHLKMMDAKIR